MEIEKLKKEDFLRGKCHKGTPTIHFTNSGCIILSHGAVLLLGLYDEKKKTYSPVTICCGQKETEKSDFFITKDPDGWVTREITKKGAAFNCKALVEHVIKKTWERNGHTGNEVMPKRMGFTIARFPVDDDKNKDVYALIRKKQ
jgi:hypothetical protein